MVVVTSVETGEQDQRSILDEVKKMVEAGKGEIASVDSWGRRELAYPIKKNTEGLYSIVSFKSDPAVPQKINSKFKLMDEILRFLLVKKESEKAAVRGKKLKVKK